MILTLVEDNFINNSYTVAYGTQQEALFQIVDSSFEGLGVPRIIDRINILTRSVNADGTPGIASLQSPIIGIGNGIVGVRSADSTLRGQVLTRHNMGACEILLYEADGSA